MAATAITDTVLLQDISLAVPTLPILVYGYGKAHVKVLVRSDYVQEPRHLHVKNHRQAQQRLTFNFTGGQATQVRLLVPKR